MWGCEDVDQQMWGCEDVDQQMWGCEDVDQQMWGCEDVLQRCFFTKNPSQALSGKRKSPAPKLRRSADRSQLQPWCSQPNTIYNFQLQKTIVLRMQPRHQATMTQPLQCGLQHHVANPHVSTHMATEHDNNHAAITLRCATRDSTSA